MNPKGRFLRLAKGVNSEVYFEIGDHDARKKVTQALRDKRRHRRNKKEELSKGGTIQNTSPQNLPLRKITRDQDSMMPASLPKIQQEQLTRDFQPPPQIANHTLAKRSPNPNLSGAPSMSSMQPHSHNLSSSQRQPTQQSFVQ